MTCPRCQHENRPQAKFCEECAAPLARTCPQCGTQLSATAKFCSECSHPVDGSLAPQQRFTSPQAYTPKHLAERILTSKAALEGERKQVTVLFADVKGSTELLADRDPEEARKLLDPVLERMMEAVHRYEGTVNQVMGDGIMALFGAPVAHEDHAVRACYAALRMQASIGRYAESVRRTEAIAIHIRIGLNSGDVVVRSIGSDLHMDYTAVGQTTHLAARMEQLAQPGSTLLTAHTLRLAEAYMQVRPLGPVSVKGLVEPLEIYELTGASSIRTRLQAMAARGLTQFVGRSRELDQLHQALDRARAGHGQLVALVGEPGVGKSRTTHSHRTEGWRVLEASSVSHGKATPYLPVVDLLKTYFKIEDRDDAREMREKVTGRLLTLDRALEPALVPLLALLEVLVEDPGWAALDPRERRQRTLDAIRQILLRESQVQPLLLVFEDLHWIDAESQALLEALVESLPAARLLLLLNYRPEYHHAWGSRTSYTQLRLDPLPPESAEHLLGVLLGPDPGLEPLVRVLIKRTEGNPFFLEESVRTLVETGTLTGEPGSYRLVQPLPAVQVPATVHAVLAARLDRLSPGDKALLQAASVVGKDVPFALLEAIAGEPEEALRGALGRLQAAEFLYEARLFPDLEYTFKHALTHEVTYRSLLQDRRRLLHRQIIEVLERLYPQRLAEQVERLAHHAIRGEMWEHAFRYLRDGAAKAITRSAYREAIGFCEEALRVVPHFPDSRETLEQAIDIRFELRHALAQVEGYRTVRNHLQEAEKLATALGDRRRLGWVYDYLGNYHYNVGELEPAVQAATRALAIGADLGDLALTVAASFHLGGAHWRRGDYQEAAQVLGRTLEILAQRPEGERLGLAAPPSILVRVWLALVLAELGQFHDAVRHAAEAVRIAQDTRRDLDLTYAYSAQGVAYLRQGDLVRAIPPLERGLPRGRAAFPALVHELAGPLGCAYALSKRVAEALPLLMEAVDSAAAAEETGAHSILARYLGEGYLLADRADDAREAGDRALRLACEHGSGGTKRGPSASWARSPRAPTHPT